MRQGSFVHPRTEAWWSAREWEDGSSWAGGSSRFALVRVEAAVVASQGPDSEHVGRDERWNSGGLAARKACAETAGREVVDRERSGSRLAAGHQSMEVSVGLKGPRLNSTEPRLVG